MVHLADADWAAMPICILLYEILISLLRFALKFIILYA